jgi:hypothetical protein
MNRIAMMVAGALALAACAPATYYVRPGGTTDDFETDKAACEAQAMAADNPFMIPQITDRCLRGKGWRDQAKATAEKPPPPPPRAPEMLR